MSENIHEKLKSTSGKDNTPFAPPESFIQKYFAHFSSVAFDVSIESDLLETAQILTEVSCLGGTVFFVGNGASATIASHCALDFTKQAGIRSMSFNDSALLTAYGNDYGYEWWVVEALKHHARAGDAVIFISSSGRSPNIIRGAQYARAHSLRGITFSGFEETNPLCKLGEKNFWANSQSYNTVETVHMLWLVALCDLIVDSRMQSKALP